jgi:predicted transcriptional regulator of viral defense system
MNNLRPSKGQYVEVMLRAKHTVFSTKDTALLWGEDDEATIINRLNKYAKAGKLVRVCRGIYAKDASYDRFEMATRIYTPSYISFESVLTRTGVNFQYYDTIFVASYLTRDIEVDGQKISLVRMRGDVLSNIMGIENRDGVWIATRERAFLDRLYVSKDYHFDNVDGLDWEKIFEILPVYHNKRMEKKVEEYHQYFLSHRDT